MPPTEIGPLERVRRRHRNLAMARWAGVVFGVGQIASYDAMTYPDGLLAAAIVLVGVLAAANLAFEVARRRTRDLAAAHRLSAVSLSVDVAAISALVWVYAFDPVSALFAVLFLLPIEAAMLFGPRATAATWAVVSLLYVGREWFGVRYGNPWEWSSLTFRIGLIGLVALVVALLVRDLEEQREIATEARRVAEEAAEWRARLVSLLAHDVRGPLASIHAASRTIADRRGDLDDATVTELANVAVRQSQRALRLARDLLDVAQVEAGTIVLASRPTALAPLVAEAVAATPGGEAIEVDVPDGLAVHGDPARLEQVLHNLLSNALRHGSPPVEISGRTGDDGLVELTVRDHGPGVPGDIDLFAAFAGRGEGSVGLGVWASRLLAEAHGGTLSYRSADPGAAFTLRLPAAVIDRARSDAS